VCVHQHTLAPLATQRSSHVATISASTGASVSTTLATVRLGGLDGTITFCFCFVCLFFLSITQMVTPDSRTNVVVRSRSSRLPCSFRATVSPPSRCGALVLRAVGRLVADVLLSGCLSGRGFYLPFYLYFCSSCSCLFEVFLDIAVKCLICWQN
jgi:hypothetical protein